MLPCCCRCNHLLRMHGMRRGENDSVNPGIRQKRFVTGREGELLRLCKCVQFGRWSAACSCDETNHITAFLNRLDYSLSPPTHSDDRGIDHFYSLTMLSHFGHIRDS